MELTGAIHESIVAKIYGMFAVGLIQGILIAIGFWMTGLRGSFVLTIHSKWSKAIGLFVRGTVVIWLWAISYGPICCGG